MRACLLAGLPDSKRPATRGLFCVWRCKDSLQNINLAIETMAGAPKGNQNAAKSRVFENALRRAIAQDDGKRLRAAAEKLLDEASEGKAWAIAQLADRLDGKADQTINFNANVESMSLAELAAEVAAARAGDQPQAEGSDGLGPVH